MFQRLSFILVCLSILFLAVPASAVITSETYTSVVGQTIPDGPSGGGHGTPLLNTIDCSLTSLVVGVEVYLDISMTDWTSDLIVRLTSPVGTTLGLAWIGEGGIPNTNIVGWFPVDFTPHDSMDAWIGEVTEGPWELDCRDYSNGAVGTLNQWRLKVTYDDSVPVECATLSGVKALFN